MHHQHYRPPGSAKAMGHRSHCAQPRGAQALRISVRRALNAAFRQWSQQEGGSLEQFAEAVSAKLGETWSAAKIRKLISANEQDLARAVPVELIVAVRDLTGCREVLAPLLGCGPARAGAALADNLRTIANQIEEAVA